MKGPKAPPFLKVHGKRHWHQAHGEREWSQGHELKRLEMACRLVDEMVEYEDTLRVGGPFTTDRWGRAVPHPALKALQEARILYLRCVRELGLDLVAPEEPRVPGRY